MATEAQERYRIEVNEMATGEEEMDVTKPNEKESSEAIEIANVVIQLLLEQAI